MDDLIKCDDVGRLINKMSKETLEAILTSENLSAFGTKKELKTRLRNFVNDRRDASARDTTIFDDSLDTTNNETQHNVEQPQQSAENPQQPLETNRQTQEVGSEPPSENLPTDRPFDTAMKNLFAQGSHVRETLDSLPPMSRSTTHLTSAPLPEMPSTSHIYTNANLPTDPVTTSSEPLYPNLSQFSSEPSSNVNVTQSSTLNANAGQFQPSNASFGQQNVPILTRQNSVPQNNVPQNQTLYNNDINRLFVEFCKFLQFSNQSQPNQPQIPQNQQFLPLQSDITQQTHNIPQSSVNTTPIQSLVYNIPQNTLNTTHTQPHQQANFPQPSIDPKRMSYISQSIEKRKVYFNGKQGSDPHRFLEYLNECLTILGITHSEIYNCLPVVLHGEALDWFRINKSNMNTFEKISKALISNFSVKNYQDKLLYEALARQQGKNEPITTFVTNIRLIFNQMEPKLPHSRQLDITCNNLNPNYIQQIKRSQIKTFEDLIDEGNDVENNLEKIKSY